MIILITQTLKISGIILISANQWLVLTFVNFLDKIFLLVILDVNIHYFDQFFVLFN